MKKIYFKDYFLYYAGRVLGYILDRILPNDPHEISNAN